MLKKLENDFYRQGRQQQLTLWGNLWIEYEDKNGLGVCNPDIVIEADDRILILECKLTQTDVAEHQIFQLYAPCVKFMWNKPVFGIAVFRTVLHQIKNPILNLTDLLDKELIDCDVFSTWHLTI